jgi:hypothetical protein
VNKSWLLLGVALAAAPAANAQNVIGEVFSADAGVRGAVIFAKGGMQVLSGSQVTAGEEAALLKLERGGELRICAKTNLSLSADSAGKSLVLGLSAGSMELNYGLASSADLLITPDFRLQLISPGSFHLAISVAPTGDTCVRTLPGNDAAVFVSEMMGSDSYQLSAGKSVMFRAGKISGATEAPAVCGCPETKSPVEGKAAAPEAAPTLAEAPAKPETQPAADNAAHMEVDSAFVYRGDESVQDIAGSVSRLSASSDNSKLALALLPQVNGPAAKEPGLAKQKETRLHRFRKFLGHLFAE